MNKDLGFIVGTGFAIALVTTFACAEVADPCGKNHYILTTPGDCIFPAQGSESAGKDHWTAIGPDGAKVVALLVDPHTPTTVFAGTVGAGVLKSTDGGASWAASNSGLPTLYVPTLAVDPTASAT